MDTPTFEQFRQQKYGDAYQGPYTPPSPGGSPATSVGGMDNKGDMGSQIDPNIMSKLFGMQALKTPHEAKNLGDIFKLLNPDQTPQMQQRHDSLQTALQALDSAKSNLVDAGGAKGPFWGHLATLPILGQLFDKPGAAYHDTRIELATQLAKALTGGTRPGQTVVDQYLKSLPDVNQDPKYVQDKLDILRNQLNQQAKSFNFRDLLDTSGGNTGATSGDNGKSIIMTSPDGKKYNVPPEKISLFRQNGYQ